MKIDRGEVKAALGWTLVVVVILGLSAWMMKADAHPLSSNECDSLAEIGFNAAKTRNKGGAEYEEQAAVGYLEGRQDDLLEGGWAMHVVHKVYTDPDIRHETPEKVRSEIMLACMTSWGDGK